MVVTERSSGSRRLVLALIALLPLLLITDAVARTGIGSGTPTPRPVTAVGCEEHEAWVDGDPRAVSAALPKPYTPVVDAAGNPVVFARAEHCSAVNVDGATRPVTIADWGIVVNSPDGFGCASGTPVVGTTKGDLPPICNWYTLTMFSNDRRLIGWLRQGTPTLPVAYSPHLTYQQGAPDALGRTAFHFTTTGSSPAGFSLDDVSSFHPGQLSLRGGYWFATPHGTVKMVVSTDDLTTGRADTVLDATAGSPLAHLMGATRRTNAAPYEEFGVIRVGHGVLRKQLFGRPSPGERTQRFAGSCSAQGEVTFNPPATNNEAWTRYAYDAHGTCTGRLNGRAVSGVPVHLRHAGSAYASCLQGLAFPPGTGALRFPGHPPLPYTIDFETNLTEVDGTIYGTRSGQASGHATFLTQRTSPTITAECATTGVKRAPLDLSFSTQRDLISQVGG